MNVNAISRARSFDTALRNWAGSKDVQHPSRSEGEWLWTVFNDVRRPVVISVTEDALEHIPTDVLVWAISGGVGNRFFHVGWNVRIRRMGEQVVTERLISS